MPVLPHLSTPLRHQRLVHRPNFADSSPRNAPDEPGRTQGRRFVPEPGRSSGRAHRGRRKDRSYPGQSSHRGPGMNIFLRFLVALTPSRRFWYKPDPFTDVCVVVKVVFGKMYHNGTWTTTPPPNHINCRCSSVNGDKAPVGPSGVQPSQPWPGPKDQAEGLRELADKIREGGSEVEAAHGRLEDITEYRIMGIDPSSKHGRRDFSRYRPGPLIADTRDREIRSALVNLLAADKRWDFVLKADVEIDEVGSVKEFRKRAMDEAEKALGDV